MNIQELIRISRPRFWLYAAGPYLIGLAAASHTTLDLAGGWTLIFLFYFLFPANLFVYGINDIYDYETDKLNPKKLGYELLLNPNQHKPLSNALLLFNVPFWILSSSLSLPALLSMLGFILLSVYYSAPPIRAKTKPFFDSLCNILYLFPGWFGFYLNGGHGFNWKIFIAGACWVMAMHSFSAIPDIIADTKSGLATIATLLGQSKTLLFCGACYTIASFTAVPSIGVYAYGIGALYVALMILTYSGKRAAWVFKIYTWFPLVNGVVGFSLFIQQVLRFW